MTRASLRSKADVAIFVASEAFLLLAFALGTLPQVKIVAALAAAFALAYWLVLPRTAAHGAAMSFAVTWIAVVGFDGLLRLAAPGLPYYRSHERFAHNLPECSKVGRWAPNVRFESVEFGDLAAMSGNRAAREPRRVRFVTDDLGFRNESRGPDCDLVILGDSFGAGIGTDQPMTFASRLAAKLQGRVTNASFPGSPWQEYVNFWLAADAIGLRPGGWIVWVLFAGNDLDDTFGSTDVASLRARSPLRPWLVRFNTWRHRSIVGQILGRMGVKGGPTVVTAMDAGKPLLFYRPYVERCRRTLAEIERHPSAPAFTRTVRAMKDRCRDRGYELVVVSMPAKEEIYRPLYDPTAAAPDSTTPFATYLAGLCAADTIAFLDLTRGVAAAAKGSATRHELLWWRDDTHINERGHAVVADLIAEWLEKRE